MITIDKDKCPQNHRCMAINVCPTGAISQNGIELPIINKGLCIECEICLQFCPKGAMQKIRL